MTIPKDVLIDLATAGFTRAQAEAVLDLLYEVEAATLEELSQGPNAVEARRAADRERQRRYRQRRIEAAATEIVRDDGRFNEGEFQRRRQVVFERDNFTCSYCGVDCRDDPQCDHIVPVVQGGTSAIENLTTACRACNSSKAGRSVEEWRRA